VLFYSYICHEQKKQKMSNKLSVLSFGGGQDSTAILYKLMYDKQFRSKYAPNDIVVVMANTLNEHDATYEHIEEVRPLCEKFNIPFFLLDMEYTPKSWSDGLIEFYEAGNRVGSKVFPKTCTDNLKIKPIYSWLEEYIYIMYDMEKFGRKSAFYEFASKYGKIDVMVGIAKGEEKRAGTNEDAPHKWMRENINKVYPLLDLGMDRQACQDYIKSVGHKVPPPSNCILCPFMSEQELLHLYRYNREWFDKWVELEANKIKANSHLEPDRNMGVWGIRLLPEMIKVAQKKYGHMTKEELDDYKMSHGHCVMSKY